MGRLRLSWLGELMVILPLMLCVFQLLGLLIGWIVDKIWGGHELDAIVSWFWIGGWLLWLFWVWRNGNCSATTRGSVAVELKRGRSQRVTKYNERPVNFDAYSTDLTIRLPLVRLVRWNTWHRSQR